MQLLTATEEQMQLVGTKTGISRWRHFPSYD